MVESSENPPPGVRPRGTHQIVMSIDSRLECVALIGATTSGICSQLGMDDFERFQTELCLGEAANNCIEHAYGGEAGNTISILLSLSPTHIEIAIHDQGRPMPADTWPQVARPPADPPDISERGRGLWLLRELTEDVRYQSSEAGNVLTLRRRHQGTGPLALQLRAGTPSVVAERAPQEPLVSDYAADPDMADLIEEFVAGLPAHCADLHAAVSKRDVQALLSLAHQLKGAAGSYGFSPLSIEARRVETLLRGEQAADWILLEKQVFTLIALCRRTQ